MGDSPSSDHDTSKLLPPWPTVRATGMVMEAVERTMCAAARAKRRATKTDFMVSDMVRGARQRAIVA